MLLAHLSDEQAQTYTEDGYFVVTLPPRVDAPRTMEAQNLFPIDAERQFCFHPGQDSVIFTLHNGLHINQMCTHLYGLKRYPVDDVLLAHKLMLENDPTFLRDAAFAECYADGHQDPHLRGAYFTPDWTGRALPKPGDPPHEDVYRVFGGGPRVFPGGVHMLPGDEVVYRIGQYEPVHLRYEAPALPQWKAPANRKGLVPQFGVLDEWKHNQMAAHLRDMWDGPRDHEVEGLRVFWRGEMPKIEFNALDVKLAEFAYKVEEVRLNIEVTKLELKVLDILNRLRELPGEALALQLGQQPKPVEPPRNLWNRELHALHVQQPDVREKERLVRILRGVHAGMARRA